MELRQALSDWTDGDVSAFALGKCIGLFPSAENMRDVKATFWTSNKLGDGLRAALVALVASGVLEHRDDPDDQYRWVTG